MGIPDPVLNCLLEVCCGAAKAQEGYVKWLVSKGVPEQWAKTCAAETFEYFEFMPRGSMTQAKADIARVAKA
jgi:hypothetical protein